MAKQGAGHGRWWLVPSITLVIGLVITGALADISHRVYERNQQHLLDLRARDAGSILTEALPGIQTALASAAELAAATNGNAAKFERFVKPYVAKGLQHEFITVSLWRLGVPERRPITVVGAAPKLAASRTPALFARAHPQPELSVVGLLGAPDPRLGFGYAAPGAVGNRGYAAYAEVPLPADHRSPVQRTSEFAGLDYALYLGHAVRAGELLLSSAARRSLVGRNATLHVAFGDRSLTLQIFARGSLTGSLPRDLPWIILVGGLLLSATAAFGALVLNRRRRFAERLAGENRRLYAEQRGIAQTLQHALLPDRLPVVQGMEAAARYAAGERSVDIGGDWYDVIEWRSGRLLTVVGDVSGRGLKAATTMASLRYAIRAYAAEKDTPATIIGRLSRLLDIVEDGQFATVLCVEVTVDTREITVTSAGHLAPLLIGSEKAAYVPVEVGLPVGLETAPAYQSTTLSAPAGATLLVFSDGLVERRGEDIEIGLARLAQIAAQASRECDSLVSLLDRLVEELPDGRASDDIAIVGLRWTT